MDVIREGKDEQKDMTAAFVTCVETEGKSGRCSK
jgi:hypothetical protein